MHREPQAHAIEPLGKGRRPGRWIKRAALAVLILLLGVAISGMIYQRLATKSDERRFPPPGKLVNVGGHKLHIYGVGEQGPVVIMDAGLGGWSMVWRSVQTEIGQFARAYAYDRAGYGWSEAGPKPRSCEQAVREFRALLKGAGLEPPYILVGHSLGGLHMRMFATMYPNEVAGLVLIESAHEAQEEKVRSQFPGANPFYMPVIGRLILRSAPLGLPRLINTYLSPQKGTSAEAHMLEVAMTSRTCMFDAMLAEWAAMPNSFAEMRAMHQSLNAMPLVVVSRGKRTRRPMPGVPDVDSSERIWDDVQQELTRISSRGRRIIADGSGHDVMIDEPIVVIDAVRSLTSELTSNGSAKSDAAKAKDK